MRFGAAVLALVFLLAAGSAARQPGQTSEPGEVLIIAHRGAAGHAPENTLEAFSLAIQHGADMLELDIRATADGELVVIHDERVDRTTNGTGLIRELTLAQIKELDAGYTFSPDGKSFPFSNRGVTIPTLLEVLQAFPDIPLLLDVKDLEPAGTQAFIQLLKEAGALERSVIGCFDDQIMASIQALNVQLPLAAANRQIAAFYTFSRVGLAAWLRPDFQILSIPPSKGILRLANPVLVRTARTLGLQVWVWTINDQESIKYYLALGVDGIITDYPDLARQELDNR